MKECVGCGYCCMTAMCAVGVYEYNGNFKQCPGLEEKKNVLGQTFFRCRLAHAYPNALAIGAGCCSPLNTLRRKFE